MGLLHSRDQWFLFEARGLEATLELPTIHCRLPMAEQYAKVELGERCEVRALTHECECQVR